MTRPPILALSLAALLGAPVQGADKADMQAICRGVYAAEMAYAVAMDKALTRCASGKDADACDLGMALFVGFPGNPVKEITIECIDGGLVTLTEAEEARGVKLHERLARVHGPAANARMSKLLGLDRGE